MSFGGKDDLRNDEQPFLSGGNNLLYVEKGYRSKMNYSGISRHRFRIIIYVQNHCGILLVTI